MNSKNYVIPPLVLILFWLTGCETASFPNEPTLNIYQTPILRLEAGTEVQTKDGLYKAQVDEVWHSDDRYRSMERQLLDSVGTLH